MSRSAAENSSLVATQAFRSRSRFLRCARSFAAVTSTRLFKHCSNSAFSLDRCSIIFALHDCELAAAVTFDRDRDRQAFENVVMLSGFVSNARMTKGSSCSSDRMRADIAQRVDARTRRGPRARRDATAAAAEEGQQDHRDALQRPMSRGRGPQGVRQSQGQRQAEAEGREHTSAHARRESRRRRE